MAANGISQADTRVTLTLTLCFLAALAEGFDVQSMGVAAPTLAPALGLTRDQLGPAFSASVLGLLIGALACGRLADRYGRKWVLTLSLAVFGIFTLATAAAWNFDSLLVIRLLTGLGLGGAMPNLLALAAEAVGADSRSRVVTLVTSAFPFGAASAGAIAGVADWHGVFIVGGLAPLALAAVTAILLPESQRFVAATQAPEGDAAGFVPALFGGTRATTTFLLWTATFGSLLSLYLLLNWLPTLMAAKGVSKADASLISLLFNFSGGIAVLVVAKLLGRPQRAAVIAGWYAATAVSIWALAASGADLVSAAGAAAVAGAFVSSAPLILYGLAPTYYPVAMRGTGIGANLAVGRIGAIVGPLFAGWLLAIGLGGDGVLLALLPLVAIACVASLAVLGRPTVGD
jgi:AAHS family 3-hydroxyphenylpropionic acid transporter